jgi:hypothetical protein
MSGMETMATPEGSGATNGLVWLQEQTNRCPICHHGLIPQIHVLELELSKQTVTGSIRLFHCSHCPAPILGLLFDLERVLNSAVQTSELQQVMLFEIDGFCVDGSWLEPDVETHPDQQAINWDVFAQRLEAQTELAESEALRRRFMYADVYVATGDDRWSIRDHDAEDA